MIKLCWNAIVRNEAARIVRCMESLAPHISSYVVVDTGSTDDTEKLITAFMHERKIPGLIGKCQFEDFSQARNVALSAARASPFEFDYMILVDADMALRVKDPTWLDDVNGPSFDMVQIAGTLAYSNRRLVKKDTSGIYLGCTHEYINIDSAGLVSREKADFVDYADGANRPEKFKRDIKLLKDGIKKEPDNYRYFYYLAQSYRDAGKHEKAAKWYKKRVDAGGWDEERWSAQSCYAACLRSMGDDAGFVRETLAAYNMRPSRAETMFDLAKYYRERGENATSLVFSETGMQIPYSKDGLFVNDYVYECGCKDEYAICAFYDDRKRTTGYVVCNELMLKKGPYGMSREMARNNMFYYHPPLATLCPSFKSKQIKVDVPDGYIAMNPSVIEHDGKLIGLVRTVNYNIDEHGRYMIRGTDGTANDSNPIHTRTLLVTFDDDLNATSAKEVLPPVDMPEPKYKLVVGFEDMRLFSAHDKLWANACVRELSEDGLPEQVLVEIGCDDVTLEPRMKNMKRMLRQPRQCEKNWMPIFNYKDQNHIYFMYRCGEVVDSDGAAKMLSVPDWDIGALGGGSQVLPYGNGYLSLVHEARQIPGKTARYYIHRFVAFDHEFKVRKITTPFHFNEKGIEYAMGLAWHPEEPTNLVISYGFKDREARIGTVSQEDVNRLLTL